MLPKPRRVRTSEDFTACVRGGVRAGRSTMVVYLRIEGDRPAAAGFIVSKAVGNSVVRHRVVRRLRHVFAPLLDTLPPGARVVVRALPAAADAGSSQLRREAEAALGTTRSRLARRSGAVASATS